MDYLYSLFKWIKIFRIFGIKKNRLINFIDNNPSCLPRQTVTDLDITDDVDERDGDDWISPSIAKYTRAIPWKPSNERGRLNQTINQKLSSKKWYIIPVFNTHSLKQNNTFEVGSKTLSDSPNLKNLKANISKSKYPSINIKNGNSSCEEIIIETVENDDDEEWVQGKISQRREEVPQKKKFEVVI